MTRIGGPAVRLPIPRRGEAELAADVEARLGSHIKAAEQALIAAKTEALRPFDVTVAQYAAMMSLYYVPGQSSAQLARLAAVTPQTMGTILDRLEDKQLVQRETSKLHRKVLVVTLTPAGEALLVRADEAARSVEQRLAEAFTDQERGLLTDLLRRATTTLRDQPDRDAARREP